MKGEGGEGEGGGRELRSLMQKRGEARKGRYLSGENLWVGKIIDVSLMLLFGCAS